jgi:hypothetical protein
VTNELLRDRRRRRRWRQRIIAVSLLVIVAFSAITARFIVWPDLPPVPARVDAIIELGGEAALRRDRVALDLAEAHRAPFLVQSTVPEEAGTTRCLPPVPEVTILCFYANPNTTQGEARYIEKEAVQRHWKSIVLVTTPDQASRARLWITRCFSGSVYVVTAPLPAWRWPRQIAYQWAAFVKAFTFERRC